MDPQPPRRSSAASLILAFVVIVGSAAGGLYYHASQRDKGGVGDASGFNVPEVPRPREAAGDPSAPAPQSQSGLSLVTGAVPGMQFDQIPEQSQKKFNPIDKAAASFKDLVRQSERAINNLAIKYSRNYPVVVQYGREWMRYPDLKKLNDDYMRNHDPIAFMRGVAASPNFGTLLKKYASEKPMRDFIMEAGMVVPPGALNTATDYLNRENSLASLVDSVARSLGLPPGLLAKTK